LQISNLLKAGGDDETRTRDLCRDRLAFDDKSLTISGMNG
jgi:hypothetical protein